MKNFNKKTLSIIIPIFVLVSVCLYIKTQDVYRDKSCRFLTKVENLQGLLTQLMAASDNDCLQKYSAKQLEKIWGIKIYEFNHEEFYVAGRRSYGEQSKSYKKSLNKPYQQANDAYVVTMVHGGKFDDLLIEANKDYLNKHKGLNQWIPEKFNDKYYWNISFIEIDGEVDYKKPNLLPGFIQPTCSYSNPYNSKIRIGFSVPSLYNNYAKEITARIPYKEPQINSVDFCLSTNR